MNNWVLAYYINNNSICIVILSLLIINNQAIINITWAARSQTETVGASSCIWTCRDSAGDRPTSPILVIIIITTTIHSTPSTKSWKIFRSFRGRTSSSPSWWTGKNSGLPGSCPWGSCWGQLQIRDVSCQMIFVDLLWCVRTLVFNVDVINLI